MGAEYSHPVDKEAEQCARACAIFDLTEKYTQEGEFLAGVSRDDAEAIISTMVADCKVQTVVTSGDVPYDSFQDRVRIPIDKSRASPGVLRRSRLVVSQETWMKCLQGCSLPTMAACAEPGPTQEHGTLREVTEEEAAAFMASMKGFGDSAFSASLQECTSSASTLPHMIPPELRTSQSAQLVINEPPRDVKGKRRAEPDPEDLEETDRIVTSATKRRRWGSQPGEGSSKDGEPLAELLAKNALPKVTECDELFMDAARTDAEKAKEQDKATYEQERLAEIIRGFSGGVL